MADPQIITTLMAKREEIETYIGRIEKQLTAARFDLAHVNATIRLFEMNGEHTQFPLNEVRSFGLKYSREHAEYT